MPWKEKWSFEGSIEKAVNGKPCLLWSDVFKQRKVNPKLKALREKFAAQAGRSCRYSDATLS